MNEYLRTWTTKKEIEYLQKIGTYSPFRHAPSSRRIMLKKYISALNLREKWDSLSKKEILFAATEMLNSC
jgi:hypothetical protein